MNETSDSYRSEDLLSADPYAQNDFYPVKMAQSYNAPPDVRFSAVAARRKAQRHSLDVQRGGRNNRPSADFQVFDDDDDDDDDDFDASYSEHGVFSYSDDDDSDDSMKAAATNVVNADGNTLLISAESLEKFKEREAEERRTGRRMGIRRMRSVRGTGSTRRRSHMLLDSDGDAIMVDEDELEMLMAESEGISRSRRRRRRMRGSFDLGGWVSLGWRYMGWRKRAWVLLLVGLAGLATSAGGWALYDRHHQKQYGRIFPPRANWNITSSGFHSGKPLWMREERRQWGTINEPSRENDVLARIEDLSSDALVYIKGPLGVLGTVIGFDKELEYYRGTVKELARLMLKGEDEKSVRTPGWLKTVGKSAGVISEQLNLHWLLKFVIGAWNGISTREEPEKPHQTTKYLAGNWLVNEVIPAIDAVIDLENKHKAHVFEALEALNISGSRAASVLDTFGRTGRAQNLEKLLTELSLKIGIVYSELYNVERLAIENRLRPLAKWARGYMRYRDKKTADELWDVEERLKELDRVLPLAYDSAQLLHSALRWTMNQIEDIEYELRKKEKKPLATDYDASRATKVANTVVHNAKQAMAILNSWNTQLPERLRRENENKNGTLGVNWNWFGFHFGHGGEQYSGEYSI
ncbi:hypothetical protein QBC43DRAFT_370797 [Cladorrhinum sp. PSN259]|nr:hypothetical protein QBC43DRAFT_370797 [Cladorrhinum sp. PSN259]